MTLKEHIDDIRKGLETDRYQDEAAVSQGIVLRLLGAVGWSTFDPQIVVPQYGVEERKVDYALCYSPSKPPILIEVKRVGNIEGAERQLFEYAFHEGVSIAILTDGRKWIFFHPIGQGDYRERKVHEMDLIEDDSEKNAKRLERYLNYEAICTGEAVEAIKEDYEKVIQQRQVEAYLPEVWIELVEEKNDYLLLAIMEKAKHKVGYEPTEEQVVDFLKNLERVESREKAVHFPPIKTDKPKYERKGYFREDGSAEWSARGKRRVVSAAIVEKMRSTYQGSVIGGKGEVKYPMAVLVKHGIVEDTNYDKDGNWNAVAKIVGHPRKTESDLGEAPPSPTSKSFSTFSNPRSKTQSRKPAKLIVVTMPNGEVIKEYSGIGTFVKVIEKLIGEYGEEVVLRAADGRPIISTFPFNYPGKPDKRLGRLYISTNHTTKLKETYLKHIAKGLGLAADELRVDIVNKS